MKCPFMCDYMYVCMTVTQLKNNKYIKTQTCSCLKMGHANVIVNK